MEVYINNNSLFTKEFMSKESFSKNLPFPLFAKEGYIPPFGKGRWGGIL
jgi:hypothetical protein